jgi:hypothetical protein
MAIILNHMKDKIRMLLFCLYLITILMLGDFSGNNRVVQGERYTLHESYKFRQRKVLPWFARFFDKSQP